MKKWNNQKVIAVGMMVSVSASLLAGCRFGFASDPDAPEKKEKTMVIEESADTFPYDSSLTGTKITLLNSKAEIQVALEETAKVFQERSGIHIEVMPMTDGDSPYTKIVNLYNSGTPPTLSILDTTDVIALAREKAADLTEEKWLREAGDYLTEIDGKVYSFPLCIEGRGVIYNKAVIEETLGGSFEPEAIRTLSDFEALLKELRQKGMERPISMAKEDWSLGAHQLQFIYETCDGTSQGAEKLISQLEEGETELHSYPRMAEFLDMFDVLREYNVAAGDPLGADYDEMAIDLADGKTAFWVNGNWAWPNLAEAGAKESDAYGFLPYFMNDDEADFANQKIQASPSKQIMMDGKNAAEQEQAAAKEFLNWIVYSEIGQQMLVKACNLIPPFQNNPYEMTDPLSRDIYQKALNDKTFHAAAIVPNDHWSVLGAAMQKYLAGRCDRNELMDAIEKYWDEQKEEHQ